MSSVPPVGLIRDAVAQACELIEAMLHQPLSKWHKDDDSPVTSVDVAVDRFLKEALCPLAPCAAWLSEETEDDPSRLDAQLIWVVDPIDGTRSMIEGHPEYCVSVALVDVARGPVIGIIANPTTKDTFWACKGQGAWRNGTRLRVRAVDEPLRWLVSRSEDARGQWDGAPMDGERVRAGGLAWKMALVAAGAVHGTMTPWPRSEWDAAAGTLLVQEAGGWCADGSLRELTWNQPVPRFDGLICAADGAREQAQELARWAMARRRGFERRVSVGAT